MPNVGTCRGGEPQIPLFRGVFMLDITKQLRAFFDSDATLPLAWRKKQLTALITMLRNERLAFEEALRLDLGKNAREAWITEIGILIHEAKYVRRHLRGWMRLHGRFTPLISLPARSAVTPQPRGISLIISPWNYPVQLTLSPLIASIAAGNVAIVKPSEFATETAKLLAQKLPVYLDPRSIVVVEGGAEVTQQLLREPIDFVFFTGSTATARHIAKTAAECLTPCVLELGGKSPTVIFDVQNIGTVADRITFAKFTNAGQTCVAPDYVLIASDLLAPFCDALKASIARQFSDASSLARIINRHHFDRLSAMLGHGETCIIGGGTSPDDLRIEPTVVTLTDPGHPLMQSEIFGPILPILTLNTNDPKREAREIIKNHPTPLACYVFCDQRRDARWLHDHILSGNFVHNDALMHVSNLAIPFGGIGMSGQGVSHGYAGFQTFSHLKGSMWNTNRFDLPLRYPPYTNKIFRLIEWLLD